MLGSTWIAILLGVIHHSNSRRYAVGLVPASRLKKRENWPTVSQPTSSVTAKAASTRQSASSSRARPSIRSDTDMAEFLRNCGTLCKNGLRSFQLPRQVLRATNSCGCCLEVSSRVAIATGPIVRDGSPLLVLGMRRSVSGECQREWINGPRQATVLASRARRLCPNCA